MQKIDKKILVRKYKIISGGCLGCLQLPTVTILGSGAQEKRVAAPTTNQLSNTNDYTQ